MTEEATILICNDKGRVGLLARAQASLPYGWALAQVRDLVGRRRSFRTVPRSPRAELVAREAPAVLRGGLTALVSYYRVPADELDAIEEHYEEDLWTHTYEVKLRIACRGMSHRASYAS